MHNSGRNILITGCSSGIGRATAIHFARQQWQVIATVRNETDANDLMMTGYTNIHVHILDVEDEAQITQLTRRINAQLKDTGLDVLVNNAAISLSAPLEYASTEHIQQHFSTNVVAPMVLTRSLLPYLKRARGRIINISSVASRLPTPLMGIYSATKSALDGMSDAMRVELRNTGVKVIVVEPGIIDTPIHHKLVASSTELQQQMPENAVRYYQQPYKRNQKLQAKMLKTAAKPGKVAQSIWRAATDNSPKTRYPVGTDAKALRWLMPMMTDRMKDQLWGRLLGF